MHLKERKAPITDLENLQDDDFLLLLQKSVNPVRHVSKGNEC